MKSSPTDGGRAFHIVGIGSDSEQREEIAGRRCRGQKKAARNFLPFSGGSVPSFFSSTTLSLQQGAYDLSLHINSELLIIRCGLKRGFAAR